MIQSFCSRDSDSAFTAPAIVVDTPQPYPAPPIPEPLPLRHLLIGTPEVVQHTIHRLHNLRYAEAGFWSPPIPLPESPLIVPLHPREVMRILVRSIRVIA